MVNTNAPFYPIIYVRGYAMTEHEQNETTADPFNGFNIGSTVYRATTNKNMPAKKFVFESPLVRLISDFGYLDVYNHGLDIMDIDDWEGSIPVKSIIIYRYYDMVSTLLGNGEKPDITKFAQGLSQLILRIRDLICDDPNNNMEKKDFKCYLVAHSMGGLVCRAFLQNLKLGDKEARQCIDKVFTYATPHNGIDMIGLNVPKWLSVAEMNTFNRANMATYLNFEPLYKKTERVDWLPEEIFPSERFFCMVGTNKADYDVAMGLSKTFAGHGSDGLVKIENASVWGVNSKGKFSMPCATAYAYRAHSGPFGIVNSEEAYQNLTRFLFGDIRVDIWIDIDSVQLPAEIQQESKSVNALYQFELIAAPKGKRWYLTRRLVTEDSVACRNYQELIDPSNETAKNIFMSTIFLSKKERVDKTDPSLTYGLTLRISALDYEINRKFWPDGHFEGQSLFGDSMVVKIVAPQENEEEWRVNFDWQQHQSDSTHQVFALKQLKKDKLQMTVPFGDNKAPGIKGKMRFIISKWNDD